MYMYVPERERDEVGVSLLTACLYSPCSIFKLLFFISILYNPYKFRKAALGEIVNFSFLYICLFFIFHRVFAMDFFNV